MWAAVIAFATPLLPALGKVLALLLAWLTPSPIQLASKVPAEVESAEKKLDSGDPSSADKLG
jgi:hypothetical protein